jgi:hypothetical protein
VCADYGAICNRGCVIDVDAKLSEDLSPAILLTPVSEAVVNALPVAEPLRQVTPRDARPGSENDSVDEQAVAECGFATFCTSRKQWLQSGPLLVGQSVSLHTQL